MAIYYIGFMLSLFICTHSNCMQPSAEKPTLGTLDSRLMLAGVDDTPHLGPFASPGVPLHYDSEIYNQTNIKKIHEEGNSIAAQFLKDFFFATVFQSYTYELLGYDMEYNYPMMEEGYPKPKMSHYDTDKFKKIAQLLALDISHKKPEQLRDDIMPFIKQIRTAIDELKKNRILIDLGIAYMREKIVVEKITTVIEKTRPGDEKLSHTLYARDRMTIDLQTMIYHFMKQAYYSYIKAIKDHTSAPTLALFMAPFMSEPYYAKIGAQLNQLMEPTLSIEGIKLPTPTIRSRGSWL